ncbi:MAG: T9SS type A sorting domain-containing protein [Candidatus Marinimicrobia bacterium]|nr:T9SS type A sorting domain-containing protein [Candidatus Neomarinimicrobiota bacterium]MCF7902222.1 T9SS type A sorting domain-containing protein [Candidatus Neomarinimicrobiota bacterium]
MLLLMMLKPVAGQTLDSRYHTYEEVNAYLDSLSQIPLLQNILSVQEMGRSSNEDFPIMAAKLSDNPTMDEDEPAVLFLGQCHAEEILGLEITIGLIDMLVNGFQRHNSHIMAILQNMEIWIVPTYNPEGLRVVHGFEENDEWVQDVTYRKNRTDNNNNGIFDYQPGIGYDFDGVDPNRNYSFNWIHGDALGVGDYDYYRGPAPFSEAETRTIRDLALNQYFSFSVAYHSARSGIPEIIYYPWEWYETKYPPGYALIDGIAQELGNRIVNEAGDGHYAVTPGKTLRGNAHDWFYTQTGSISFLIEVGTNNLQPSRPLIDDTVQRNLVGCFYLIDRALGYPPESKSQMRGIVRNAQTNEPLEGATVEMWRLNVSQQYVPMEGPMFAPRKTDQYGRYRRVLQQGTYKVAVSMPGFVADTIVGISTSNNYSTDRDFLLTPYPAGTLNLSLSSSNGGNDGYVVILSDAQGQDTLEYGAGNYVVTRQTDATAVTVSAAGKFPQTHQVNLSSGEADLAVVLHPATPLFSEDFFDLSDWWGNGEWSVSGGRLKSQTDLFYTDNANSFLRSAAFSIAGLEQVGLRLDHQYEVEWELDTLSFQLLTADGVLLEHFWIDQQWAPVMETFWTSIQSESDSAWVELRVRTDSTVYFRGWEIDGIMVFGSDSAFTGVDDREFTTRADAFSASAKILSIDPNPMNQQTAVRYELPQPADVSIRVFNILGQEVYQTRVAAGAGENLWHWNGRNRYGESLSAGIYLVHFQTQNWHMTKKLLKLITQG